MKHRPTSTQAHARHAPAKLALVGAVGLLHKLELGRRRPARLRARLRQTRRVARGVACDDEADDVGLLGVQLGAAEASSQVLAQQLKRQHLLRRVAEVQTRDERDVPVALVGRRAERALRRQAGQAHFAHVEHARFVEHACTAGRRQEKG